MSSDKIVGRLSGFVPKHASSTKSNRITQKMDRTFERMISLPVSTSFVCNFVYHATPGTHITYDILCATSIQVFLPQDIFLSIYIVILL